MPLSGPDILYNSTLVIRAFRHPATQAHLHTLPPAPCTIFIDRTLLFFLLLPAVVEDTELSLSSELSSGSAPLMQHPFRILAHLPRRRKSEVSPPSNALRCNQREKRV